MSIKDETKSETDARDVPELEADELDVIIDALKFLLREQMINNPDTRLEAKKHLHFIDPIPYEGETAAAPASSPETAGTDKPRMSRRFQRQQKRQPPA